MLGEVPGHGPNNGEPLALREAMGIAAGYHGQGVKTEVEIGTLYQTLRDTLALVGINPEQTRYVSGHERNGKRPKPLSFIDLPGRFYIGFGSSDGNPFLYIGSVQNTSLGGYFYEDFIIHYLGNYATYMRDELDSLGQDVVTNESGQRGFFQLNTKTHETLVMEKIAALADALRQTITKEEHQPVRILQEANALYARLAEILPMRQLKRRKSSKKMALPGLGPVLVNVDNTESGSIRILIIGQKNTNLCRELTICQNGNVEISAGDYPHGEWGEVKRTEEGTFRLHNPHFVLMKIGELQQAISS